MNRSKQRGYYLHTVDVHSVGDETFATWTLAQRTRKFENFQSKLQNINIQKVGVYSSTENENIFGLYRTPEQTAFTQPNNVDLSNPVKTFLPTVALSFGEVYLWHVSGNTDFRKLLSWEFLVLTVSDSFTFP